MIKTKVYLYDSSQESNGYRGTEYSNCILQGQELTEDITQEMDTAEITLCGLNTNKEFDPETKFIVDIWDTDANGNDVLVSNNHFCVDRDVVSQPILSDDNYFDHHISFIEPSVIAQKRLVDNIAVTYKLKDVNLKQIPAYPLSQTSPTVMENSQFTPSYNFGVSRIQSGQNRVVYGKYFSLEGNILIGKPNQSLSQFTNLTYNDIRTFDDNGVYTARFYIPKIAIYAGVPNTTNFQFVGYASIDWKIEEFNPITSSISRVWSGSLISNSNVSAASPQVGDLMPSYTNEWIIEDISTMENVPNSPDPNNARGNPRGLFSFRKYTNVNAPTLTDQDRITQSINLQQDREYIITISLHEFADNIPYTVAWQYPYVESRFQKYTGSQPARYLNSIRDMYGVSDDITVRYSTDRTPLTYSQSTATSNYFIYNEL